MRSTLKVGLAPGIKSVVNAHMKNLRFFTWHMDLLILWQLTREEKYMLGVGTIMDSVLKNLKLQKLKLNNQSNKLIYTYRKKT